MLNVLGSLFLEPAHSMWELIDDLVDEARAETPVVVVDVHAEATSEKVALARWLDGRATAVIGTHTHVQTTDARVLPGGTAALTDVGMTGPHDSVIGVAGRARRSRGCAPACRCASRRPTRACGSRAPSITCDPATGRASAIEPVRVPWP